MSGVREFGATHAITDDQRRAASVVGWAYLAAIPLAMFGEFYVRNRLLMDGDPVQTFANVAAHEQLYRLGIACNLAVFSVDVALITGLYIAMRPIAPTLALMAAFFRVIETAVLMGVVLSDLAVVRMATGGAGAEPAASDRMGDVASLAMRGHADVYGVGLFLAGIGSAVFCYLWLRSGYVPRPLAWLGLVASLLMAGRELIAVAAPAIGRSIGIAVYGVPIFMFELTMGCWLLARGLRPTPGVDAKASPRHHA
jgi:hypothetical protein